MRTSENGYFCTAGLTWAPVIGGAVVAAAVSLILLALGSGLGFAATSPWSNSSAGKIAVGALIWLVVMQWISAGLGGYLTGRFRKRWNNIHEDEVHFRDSAHGFLAWALATILTATVLASAASSIVGGSVQAISVANAGAMDKGGKGTDPYYIDSLFRSDRPASASETDVRMEINHIFANGLKNGEIPAADKAYLAKIVELRAGISQDEARVRVDETIAKVRAATDKARKAAATFSIITALSMLVGAFIASVAAILGGKHRDEY